MTITVSPQTEEEHRALIAFLNANSYDYQIDDVTQLPDSQTPPISQSETPETIAARNAERDHRGPMKIF